MSISNSSVSSENNNVSIYDFLNERYIILDLLGEGAYANVWMAYDTHKYIYCAIKITLSEDNFKTSQREIFLYDLFNEKFNSPYLMSCYDSFEYESYYCCVMKLMGHSIYDLLKIYKKKYNTGFDYDFVIKIIYQVILGLNILHTHDFIHGDIKPENILLNHITNQQQILIDKYQLDTIAHKIKEQVKNKKNKKKINISKSIYSIFTEYIKTFSNKNNDNGENNENNENNMNDKTEDINNEHDINNDFNNNVIISLLNNYDHSKKKYFIDDDNYSTESEDSDYLNYELDEPIDDTVDDEFINTNAEVNDLNIIDQDIKITLSDFGWTNHLSLKQRKNVQTIYYRSPEILLGLNYDTSSDIWAIGCTIYELLTGEILFNSLEENNIDNKRQHLSIITETVGQIPIDIINKSSRKYLYFDSSLQRIKGDYIQKININNNLRNKLLIIAKNKKLNHTNTENFINLMLGLLNVDKQKRTRCHDVLNHDVFKAMIK